MRRAFFKKLLFMEEIDKGEICNRKSSDGFLIKNVAVAEINI